MGQNVQIGDGQNVLMDTKKEKQTKKQTKKSTTIFKNKQNNVKDLKSKQMLRAASIKQFCQIY